MPGASSSARFEGADVGLIADRCSAAALTGTSVWSQLVNPLGVEVTVRVDVAIYPCSPRRRRADSIGTGK
jgi:hypothetical protein